MYSSLDKSLSVNPTTMTKSGVVSEDVSFLQLNSTTKIEATVATVRPGRFLVIAQIDAGTAGHTVTIGSGDWNGSNAIATFDAKNECIVVFGISSSTFVVVENIGTVGFSG